MLLPSYEHMRELNRSKFRADPMLQESRATAVVVAAPKGHDVFPINCKDVECTWPLSTPATMVGYEAGQQLLVSLSSLTFLLLLWQKRQQSVQLLHGKHLSALIAWPDQYRYSTGKECP